MRAEALVSYQCRAFTIVRAFRERKVVLDGDSVLDEVASQKVYGTFSG